MRPNRAGWVAAALGTVALLAAGCSSASAPAPTGTSPSASASAPSGGTGTGGTSKGPAVSVAQGPQPPASGAWVGAWVKPAKAGQTGRVDAVADFERTTGRPLDLVHVYHPWSDPFPDAADRAFLDQGRQLMISWSGTDSSQIVAGTYDDLIRQRATDLKALGKPVLLRWRWEMNRANLDATVGGPADFVAAWKHIRAIFQQVGADNVGWVWCPLAGSFTATDAPAYYPGDDQVDWLCADVYAIGTDRSFADVATDFMAWAAGHAKPIVIGEYGSDQTDPAAKAAWVSGATAYAQAHPQIRAMVYFDADRVDDHGVQRDFRVTSDPTVLHAFQAMLGNPWFGT